MVGNEAVDRDGNVAWEHFSHDADIGVRGFGRTLEKAFENAALALTAVVVELETVRPRERVAVACVAAEPEALLVEWLNALIYEMAVRRMLFVRFEVRIEAHRLFGEAWGEPVDPERHRPAVEVKGATYTELRVARDPDGRWLAQCVVDV